MCEVAAKGGAWAAYLNAGQVCTSAERFYVARELYDDFVLAFVDHARHAASGRPARGDDGRRPDGLCRDSARRSRHRSRPPSRPAPSSIVGGDRAGHERGHYFAPAVVTGAAAETDLLSEETFGPVRRSCP